MKETTKRIVIVGGGPSGFCAAIAAAHLGAKVTLIEQRGFLGGNAVMGLCLHTFHSMDGNQVIAGLPDKIITRLKEIGGSPGWVGIDDAHMRTTTPVNPELLRCLITALLKEEGVDILLNARLSRVSVRGNRIRGIEVSTVGGQKRITGDIFFDASGDGELAYMAGIPYKKGRDKDGLVQPMSMLFKMGGIQIEKLLAKAGKGRAYAVKPGEKEPGVVWFAADLTVYNDLLELEGLGEFKNREFWGNSVHEGEYNINASRISGMDSTIPEELSKAEMIGMEQVYKLSRFMKKYVEGCKDSHVISIAPFVGVRESRRIIGKYVLTREDILEGRKFEDAILRAGYPIDIHEPGGSGILFSQIKGNGYYHIPYRCLLPETVENLLVGGRCLSATHEALASTRVMITCMAIGQAAGTAAALSVNHNTNPHDMKIGMLQDILHQNGVMI